MRNFYTPETEYNENEQSQKMANIRYTVSLLSLLSTYTTEDLCRGAPCDHVVKKSGIYMVVEDLLRHCCSSCSSFTEIMLEYLHSYACIHMCVCVCLCPGRYL